MRRMAPKYIGVTDLQRRFRTVLDEVVQKGVPYVLARNSRPEAVMIPYGDFVRLQEAQEEEPEPFERLWRRIKERRAHLADEEAKADAAEAFHQLRERMAENDRYSDEEVAVDVEAAIAEVRAERAKRTADGLVLDHPPA